MREMVGGCCVCSDERGWAENPLVYCDGHGCNVAVHQACYGIVQVPTGPWFCRKCESQERAARVRCELCPHKDGALKRTDSGGWAHVVCALYIPEVQFANVLTMEPIILQYVPHERYIKTCYICEDHGRESKAACGACMACNRQGCRQAFHVTCAQMAGLLCEEEGPEADNVKYCGYCKHHYNKMQKKLRSSENTSSAFGHSRGRSTSPTQDKHHHHRQRKSHKDKLRQKERHKKTSDSLAPSVMPSSIDMISSSHHSSKDGEGKSKNPSTHGHSHRSKKTGSSGKSCSSSSSSSSPFNPGIYSSLKNPLTPCGGVCSTSVPLGGGVCSTSLSLGGGMCSTSLSSGVLPSHALALSSAAAVPSPQAHPRFSSVTATQPFTSGLPTLPPLLSQAPASLAESDLDDCHFPCQGSSPRESLSSQSPMSSLPLLFDHRDGLGAGVRACPENVPPASSHIELLLEKHGNGEMGVNIVEMLQSLHSLQQENQRLQDQILSLTAKRERMQLLNTELAVPFPHAHSVQGSLHNAPQISFLSSSPDALLSSTSVLSKSCFLHDTSFVTSSEDLHSGSPSRSSSSLSFQSTPPPQQSPASLSQPVPNGRAAGDVSGTVGQAGSCAQPGAGGLLASLVGSPQLSVNGALSILNGVIQSAVQGTSQSTLPPLHPQPPPLNPQSLAQSFQLAKSAGPSSLLSEQQKQLILEQQQQLQQFLTSQNFTPEQRTALCQMLQQQRHRELQRLTLAGALTSTPSSPSVTASPLQGGQGGNHFGLQEGALQKPAAGEKGGDKNG
ncbi:protein AF-17-like isoform X3 [Dunckerocampus dactyliophorus]|uniref:protein AF-17-like isoform X3 n=1 Tax=Dunckerocampus dactyliophorus TaxID=161453 RepID=UPI0024053901|nr:protein AF-17-like isoform X3 [Dunckerocampus dactyliophorus]